METPILSSHSTLYVYVCFSHFSRVGFFVTLWTESLQPLLSMGSSRQEYRSGLLCPPPGNLPDQGIELESLMSPALAGRFFTTRFTWEAWECPLILLCSLKPQTESLWNTLFISFIQSLLHFYKWLCVPHTVLPGQTIMTLETKDHSFLFAHDKYWFFIPS